MFFKTPKTAGTSIEVFLSGLCAADDIFTPIDPPENGHQPRNFQGYVNHTPAWFIRENVPPEVWNGYLKFSVERNPWDKTLSYYHMCTFRSTGLSFDEFLALGKFPCGRYVYTDRSGENIIVDRVLRYERLAEDLADVFGRVGIPFGGDLGSYAKSGYRTDRRPYQEIYTPTQRKMVEDVFAWEIEHLGYRF